MPRYEWRNEEVQCKIADLPQWRKQVLSKIQEFASDGTDRLACSCFAETLTADDWMATEIEPARFNPVTTTSAFPEISQASQTDRFILFLGPNSELSHNNSIVLSDSVLLQSWDAAAHFVTTAVSGLPTPDKRAVFTLGNLYLDKY